MEVVLFLVFLFISISLFCSGMILPGLLMLMIACKFFPDNNDSNNEQK